MPDEHTKPPQTIQEVGIHIGYMRDDISELKELAKNGFATKEELKAVTDRVEVLEKNSGLKNTLQWVGLATTTIISLFAVFNLFGGGK